MDSKQIKEKITTVRDKRGVLDRDLASLYGVETKVFNQTVKRNHSLFGEDAFFQ